MSRTFKIVGTFAACGFGVAWLLLGYSAVCFRLGIQVEEAAFLMLCPSSILAMGLDGASAFVALIGWLVIAILNAALYAILGFVISLVLRPSA